MNKEEYEKILPMMKTLNAEESKVIWYIEAIKKGNPCITEEEKNKALKMPLIDLPKLKLHNWNHKDGNNYY